MKSFHLTWATNHPERRLMAAIFVLLRNHKKLIPFIFDVNEPRLAGNPVDLVFESGVLSSGEQVLVQLVLDLWDNAGETRLQDVIQILDIDSFSCFLRAIAVIRGLKLEIY